MELGITQDTFASDFGLSRLTYAQWERGYRKPDKAAGTLLAVIVAFPSQVMKVVNPEKYGKPEPRRMTLPRRKPR